MRTRVVIIAGALLLIAAVLFLRRGAEDEEGAVVRDHREHQAGVQRRQSGEAGGIDMAGRDTGGSNAPGAANGAAPGEERREAGGSNEAPPGSVLHRGAQVVVGPSKKGGTGVGSSAGERAAGGGLDAPAPAGLADKPLGSAAMDAGRAHGENAAAHEAQPEAAPVDDNGEPAIPGVVFSSTEDQTYPTNEPIDIPDTDKLSRDTGSVNFWLQPGWDGGNQDDADFIDLGDGGLRVVKNVNFLRFEFTDANGIPGGVGVEITDWKVGDERQVTATWDGSTINLYVDGKLVSQRPNPGLQRSDEAGPVVVGSVYPPDRPIAPGVLSGVQLFDRPLDPGEIANMHLTPPRKK